MTWQIILFYFQPQFMKMYAGYFFNTSFIIIIDDLTFHFVSVIASVRCNIK